MELDGIGGAPAEPNAAGTMLSPQVVEELHRPIASSEMKPMAIGHSGAGLLALMVAVYKPMPDVTIVRGRP